LAPGNAVLVAGCRNYVRGHGWGLGRPRKAAWISRRVGDAESTKTTILRGRSFGGAGGLRPGRKLAGGSSTQTAPTSSRFGRHPRGLWGTLLRSCCGFRLGTVVISKYGVIAGSGVASPGGGTRSAEGSDEGPESLYPRWFFPGRRSLGRKRGCSTARHQGPPLSFLFHAADRGAASGRGDSSPDDQPRPVMICRRCSKPFGAVDPTTRPILASIASHIKGLGLPFAATRGQSRPGHDDGPALDGELPPPRMGRSPGHGMGTPSKGLRRRPNRPKAEDISRQRAVRRRAAAATSPERIAVTNGYCRSRSKAGFNVDANAGLSARCSNRACRGGRPIFFIRAERIVTTSARRHRLRPNLGVPWVNRRGLFRGAREKARADTFQERRIFFFCFLDIQWELLPRGSISSRHSAFSFFSLYR